MEYGHPAPLHARVAILYLAASNQGLYAKRLIHPFVIHASPIERYGSAVLSVPYESYSICGSFIYNRIYLFPVDLFSLSGTFPKLSVYLCGSNGPDCPTVRFCLFIICVGYFIQQDRLEIVKISKFQSTIFSCSLASINSVRLNTRYVCPTYYALDSCLSYSSQKENMLASWPTAAPSVSPRDIEVCCSCAPVGDLYIFCMNQSI
jgi:hypothetical protein